MRVELTRTISDCFWSKIWLLEKVFIEGNIASARAMLQMLGSCSVSFTRDRQCVSNTFDWLPTCPIIRSVAWACSRDVGHVVVAYQVFTLAILNNM